MTNTSNPNDIIQRILNGTQTDDDVKALHQWLNSAVFYAQVISNKFTAHRFGGSTMS